MSIASYEIWQLEINGLEHSVGSMQALCSRIADAESFAKGRLSVTVDAGPRPFWQRFLGAKRFVEIFFAVEWFEDYASLIFYDENASEYRVIDKAEPVTATAEVRSKIAHGEPDALALDECMHKARAFRAVAEFLQTGARPSWLSYHFVR